MDVEKEYNILILGEAGVGKSTFINAFANYLAYPTMERAILGKTITLIPNEFFITDEKFMQFRVENGGATQEENSNESPSTRATKVHKFVIRNTILRVIDTPGYVDSNADTTFLEAILCSIASYDCINCIAIFLKPNDPNIRFIGELLHRLHKSVIANLVFCYTNTRLTKFRTGEQNPALEKLLAKRPVGIEFNSSHIYCFDSESYLFLSAKEREVKFCEEMQLPFAKSWDHSVKETDRLMKHVKSLAPCKISHISPVNAPPHVSRLAKLMAEIEERIAKCVKSIDHVKDVIREVDEQIQALASHLVIDKQEVERVDLKWPRTVCTNPSCFKLTQSNGVFKANYDVCHEECCCVYLSDVNNLRKCSKMNNGCCSECGHNFSEHTQITYEIEERVVQVEDESVKKKIEKKTLYRKQQLAKLMETQELISQYKEELLELENVSKSFCSEEVYDIFFFRSLSSWNTSLLMDHIFGVTE